MVVDPEIPSTPSGSTPPPPPPYSEQVAEAEPDPAALAEKTKEQGNAAFKAKRYGEAVNLYTKAIGAFPPPPSRHCVLIPPPTALAPTEAAYLTNRAAAHMALKRYRPALTDCQAAAALQSAEPSAKTLVRLARCQLALGSTASSLSTLRAALELEPGSAGALELQAKVLALEAHLRNFREARARKNWGMARLALDKCLQSIDGEGGEIPTEWRVWRVELELARGSWDAANAAAKCVMAPLSLLRPLAHYVALQRRTTVGAQLCRRPLAPRPRPLPLRKTPASIAACTVCPAAGPWARTCTTPAETHQGRRAAEGRGQHRVQGWSLAGGG